ncbi:MAG: M14 family metallopeptidase [Verrucomicrobiales bacterium]|nr:M14 family metallopeptidase [Verrucomicrobiales bacterium]
MHVASTGFVRGLVAGLAAGGNLLWAGPLPPAPAWSGASEALVVAGDHPWMTPAERTGLTDSPGYDETVAWLRRLCDASPLLDMRSFGRSAEGRELWLVIAGSDPGESPVARRRSGRPALLAQAGIHSGEIDGKDAGMMLLRDIAFGGKRQLLDGVDFLFVPIFNVDGHERSSEWNRPNQRGPRHQGWRTTAQNLNLNRDYTKADSPEMQAMLGLLTEWAPDLYLDIHVTDGIDYQYDITFGFNGDLNSPCWSPEIAGWLAGAFRPAIEGALRTAGHISGPLVFAVNNRDLAQGLSSGPSMPRFSHGYGDLRHLPAVLVENHSLKPYRQRVLGTYVLLEASLRLLASRGAALRQAIAADAAFRPNRVPVGWKRADPAPGAWPEFLGIAFEEYDSPVSGAKEVRWTGMPKVYPNLPVWGTQPDTLVSRPRAYWVPAAETEVIERLRLHGVDLEILTEARTVRVEMGRLSDPEPAALPYEGRHRLTAGVQWEERAVRFAAGSARVSTDQPLGDLAVVLLAAESADSFLAWGFFPGMLQRTEYVEGYVIAPLAEEMMAGDPGLRTEFETRLRTDPEFAADPAARLRWFYERSPYYDRQYLVYPVGVER